MNPLPTLLSSTITDDRLRRASARGQVAELRRPRLRARRRVLGLRSPRTRVILGAAS